ncbi:MAG: NGG1p interacting factor NIF3 [Verrucomicrobiota bacterium]
MSMTIYKLEIYVPASHLDALREALAGAGAGVIGNYECCMAVIPNKGYYRPLPGADPWDGEIGKLSEVDELKVELQCREDRLEAALEAMRRAHPYEEPAYFVIPTANKG